MQPSERHEESYLPLPDRSKSTVGDALSTEMQKAQEKLITLQRQQELLERQKREIEELTRKETEFETGKEEMVEKFARSLVVLERQLFESQKRLEQLRATQASFTEHLRVLEAINPNAWNKAELDRVILQKELGKALSTLDQARSIYIENRSRISAELSEDVLAEAAAEEYEAVDGHGFAYWLKSGFAFTLPLVVLGLLALVLWFLKT